MERAELERAIEAVLFAAGECVAAERIAQAVGCDVTDVHDAAKSLADRLGFDRAGVRVLRLEDGYQMCSSAEFSEIVGRALETRKPPKLSPSQLETLTIIAYYQPATKAYVEQIRGVDCSYSVGALLNKKLIEECGRLNVPGRPIQYRTTPAFLRTFGLESLDDLPEIEKITLGVRADQQLTMEAQTPDESTEAAPAQASDQTPEQTTMDLIAPPAESAT